MDDPLDHETCQDWVEEHDWSRRDLLKATTLLTASGWAIRNQLPTSHNTDARLTDAEESAATLADRLDNTDLRDPLTLSGLTPLVESTIETITAVLHDRTVTYGVWIAEQQRAITQVLSIVPWIDPPPQQSRPAKRVDQLEAALTYYQALNDTLQHLAGTHRVLATLETPALHTGDRPDQPLSNIVDPDTIHPLTENARKTGAQAASNEATASLLPNTAATATQLSTQLQVQIQHRTAIQAYLNSAARLKTGAQHHEQRQFDQARTQFQTAIETIPQTIPEEIHPYAISTNGPTLHDYHTLFAKRRQGLEQLIAACNPDTDFSTQNTRFNNGLTHLIDARDVLKQ